jgi:ABC-2 type transport system ATP-binding protein
MIEVQNVSKQFGRVRALDQVSLRIDAGERVALVGTNGSGKTTLLRAVCGLLRTQGRITLDGVDVAKDPARALRCLAYMPQLAPPLDAPVAELVRAYTRIRGIDPAALAAPAFMLGLSLEQVARTRVRDLSGGMKQKLLAALAFAANAKVLVCDEPTASLDSAARAAFFELVNARPADSVLVLCSHRVDEVRQLVGRVIELADGRLSRDLALDALLARPGVEAWASAPAPSSDEPRPNAPLRLVRPDRRAGGVP